MKVIGLAGWSGAGKTTLLNGVIPRLVARGLSIATVKHAHHAFEIDREGKDSHTHRAAGAEQVLVASSGRYALVKEHRGAPEPGLGELLLKLDPCDLVLVEGYKAFAHPKVEIHRAANGKPPLFADLPHVVGMIADGPVPGWSGPIIDINNHGASAELLLASAQPFDRVVDRLIRAGSPPRLSPPNNREGHEPLRRTA